MIFVLGLALVIGFKLLFIYSYDVSSFKEVDQVLQSLDSATDIEEEEELIDRYIAEQYKKLSETKLSSDEQIEEESRISDLYTDLQSYISAQKASADLIQNAKTGEGISLSRPSEKYYNNLDECIKISEPIKPLDQRAWNLYMDLQNFSLIPMLVMFVVCALWGKRFEYGIYRSERIALLGKKYNRTCLFLSYGILAVIQIVFFIFDIIVCGVWHSSDAAIQSAEAFFECTLNTDIFGFLLIMELFQLLNTTICFGVFYLISYLKKDLKKAVTLSAFVLMTAYVVKNSYPNALAPVLFGICDYGDLFNVFF
ncbi:MAG: hypothetical protein K2J79_09360 [Ruminiclostridium sp.]|nr:hypothetical protein [Ruminiclostridium sp.]